MPITTFFSQGKFEHLEHLQDKSLNELYQEFRAVDPNIYVERMFFKKARFLVPDIIQIRYSVYKRLDYGCEVQCMRIPTENVTYRELMAYFFGVLNSVNSIAP